MPDQNDRDYYARRAEQERAIASTCEDNSAALAHLKMADAYDQRVKDIAPRPIIGAAG